MARYLLLGWYSRPRRPLNADIANFFVRFVKLVGPIGLSARHSVPYHANIYVSMYILCIYIH